MAERRRELPLLPGGPADSPRADSKLPMRGKVHRHLLSAPYIIVAAWVFPPLARNGSDVGEQGRVEEATQHFAEALRLEPNCPEACDNLGAVLAGRGRYAEGAVESSDGGADLVWRLNGPGAEARLRADEAAGKSRTRWLRWRAEPTLGGPGSQGQRATFRRGDTHGIPA